MLIVTVLEFCSNKELTSTDKVMGPRIIHQNHLFTMAQHLGMKRRHVQVTSVWEQQNSRVKWGKTYPVFSYRTFTTVHGVTNKTGVPGERDHLLFVWICAYQKISTQLHRATIYVPLSLWLTLVSSLKTKLKGNNVARKILFNSLY